MAEIKNETIEVNGKKYEISAELDRNGRTKCWRFYGDFGNGPESAQSDNFETADWETILAGAADEIEAMIEAANE